MFRKFFIGNTVVLGCSLLAYYVIMNKREQDLYKNTRAFNQAMSTLRSNAGAIHFLGENIKDGRLRIAEEKKEDNITTYRVKVAVRGDKAIGCMNFWLRRMDEEPDVDLTRIELQIQNIKNRLLILGENKTAQAQQEIPVP